MLSLLYYTATAKAAAATVTGTTAADTAVSATVNCIDTVEENKNE